MFRDCVPREEPPNVIVDCFDWGAPDLTVFCRTMTAIKWLRRVVSQSVKNHHCSVACILSLCAFAAIPLSETGQD
jgi:hypothetical protein